MTDTNDNQTSFLDTFPDWLRSLGDDAQALAALIDEGGCSEPAKATIVGGLNYLFKSLDIIPDGIDDLGYLDDAFVLRVVAELAGAEIEGEIGDAGTSLKRLSDENGSVKEFLGADYARLEGYVRGLRDGSARGRSVQDILGEDSVRGAFLSDVRGFARSYEAPSFSREEKNLVKLKAFFQAKLPQ